MPQNLGKLLITLLSSANFDVEGKADSLKDISTLDIEIPDEAAAALKSNLMTVESAKNNLDLRNHFRAEALNAIDAKLEEFGKEYGFPDDVFSEIKKEDSSYKRMILALNKVKDLESAKAQGKGSKADDETLKNLKSEIERLNNEIVSERNSAQAKIDEAQRKAESSIIDFAMNAELASKNYANGKLDKAVNITVAKTLVDRALAEAGAKLMRSEDGSLKLVQVAEPSMDFMRENQKIAFGKFVDETLGKSNILQVSDGGSDGAGDQNFRRIHSDGGFGSGAGKDAAPTEAAQFLADQLAAFR